MARFVPTLLSVAALGGVIAGVRATEAAPAAPVVAVSQAAPQTLPVPTPNLQPVQITLPTPVPTTVPAPVQVVRPTPAATATPRPTAAPTPAPAPRNPVNRLVGGHGLNTGVGTYGDCTGQAVVPSGIAAIDTCVTQDIYFVGHNPGVFTPLISTSAGEVITWYDAQAIGHPLRIVATRNWQRADGIPPVTQPGVTVQFQTCVTADGSVDRILDAVPA